VWAERRQFESSATPELPQSLTAIVDRFRIKYSLADKWLDWKNLSFESAVWR